MPQLSIETYITQYLWLVVVLAVFYFFISSFFVPKIGEIKKTRAKLASSTETAIIKGGESQISGIEVGIIINKGVGIKGGESIFEQMNKEWTNK